MLLCSPWTTVGEERFWLRWQLSSSKSQGSSSLLLQVAVVTRTRSPSAQSWRPTARAERWGARGRAPLLRRNRRRWCNGHSFLNGTLVWSSVPVVDECQMKQHTSSGKGCNFGLSSLLLEWNIDSDWFCFDSLKKQEVFQVPLTQNSYRHSGLSYLPV